jgi:hypothetical protein
MKNLENFNQAIENEGLKWIQINSDSNDYPKGLGSYGAIGFDDYKQAEKFAEENGGDIVLFQTKGGHTFWRNKGNKYEPLTSDDFLNDCNDDVYEVYTKGHLEAFEERIKKAVAEELFEEIEEAYKNLVDFKEVLENKQDDEIVYYDGNSNSFNTCKIEMMSYSQDVYTYAVGVCFNPQIHEE